MRIIILCIALLLPAQIALSEQKTSENYVFKTREDIHKFVQAKDVDAVEALFVESDHALQDLGSTNADKFRTLMGSFEVMNPDMESFMPMWAEQYPNSVYPKIAEAFRQMRIGWFFRGNDLMRYVSNEARAASDLRYRKAANLAKVAYKMRPDLVAAADLARQVHQVGYGWRSKKGLYYETLRNHQDVSTLKRSLQGLAPLWGGSLKLVFATCEKFAPDAVANFPYDADICKAAYILDWLNQDRDPELYAWAFEVLDRTPLDGMISYRLTDLKDVRPFQKDGDKVAAALYLEMQKDPEYLISLIRNGYIFSEHFNPFLEEMAELEIPPVFKLQETYSPKSVLYRARLELERIASDENGFGADWAKQENLTEFNQILEEAELYGKYSYQLYELRAQQYQNYDGLEALKSAKITHETGIYYSNHMPVTLVKYKNMLKHFISRVDFMQEHEGGVAVNGVGEDYEQVMAQLKCPYFRASRLLEEICPAGTNDQYCRYAERFGALEADDNIANQCPELASSWIQDMVFSLPN
tara:strand:+ start:18700 stop:20280 length:1581 start_codon:yes stop_codon:yes gene_type:complete